MKRSDAMWYGALVAGIVSGATTLWWIGDFTGLRPVYKKEFYDFVGQGQEAQSSSVLFVRWLYLRDKARAGTLGPDEHGELCGIGARLRLSLTEAEGCK